MRRWFPSEFTWRLYVVLQVATLIFTTVFVLVRFENSDGSLFRYQPVYGKVDPAEIERARARCAHLSDEPRDGREINPMLSPYRSRSFAFELDLRMSPQDRCLMDEMPKPSSIVGQEYLGLDYDFLIGSLVAVLVLFLLAFLVPFAVVRVPTWLWEGWRK